MKKFFLLFVLSSALRAFGGLSFTSTLFDRLDQKELESIQSESLLDQLLVKFFKAERAYLENKIHSSEALLKSIDEICDKGLGLSPTPTRMEKARFSAVCLLSSVGFSFDRQSLALRLKSKKIRTLWESLESNPLPFEEKAYIEGRLLSRLPMDQGGDTGKSIVALESLRRLKPDLSSIDFFLGQVYESLGNDKASQQAYERAKNRNPSDNRFRLVFGKESAETFQRSIPLQSRFYFGVVSNPSGGSGIVIGKRDDRVADKKRKLDVSLSAQSRGVFGGRVLYEDEESLEPYLMRGRLVASDEIEQFFGLGSSSSLSNLTEIRQAKGQVELALKRSVHKGYYQVGGELFYREPSAVSGLESTNSYLRDKQLSLIPTLELGWDMRDSHLKTRRGGLLYARFGFSKRGLLGSHNFEAYRFGARKWFSLPSRGVLVAKITQNWVSSSAPFGILSQISGNPPLPGVRWGRFRDKAALAATLEWETPLVQDLSFSLFGNVATLGAKVDDCWRGRPLWGGGGALSFGKGVFLSRLEIAQFEKEMLIQAGLQLSAE